ncbi:MAG: DUF2283 domain-containing protein [Pseudomonadota bacterium]
MAKNVENLTMSETGIDTLYVQLPGHPGKNTEAAVGCVKEMIQLNDLFADRNIATMVNFDFDENRNLIGIEILL